ncbi:MAG: DUF6491 family protein [Rhodanobacteraceae bacterium]
MKRTAIAIATTLAAIGCGVASASSIKGARDIQRYQNAAGSDVQQMPAAPMVDWQALDNHSLAVWTANDKPWLVRVQQPCNGLSSADSVAMTSTDGKVMVGTDAVRVGSAQCKIASIQPIDYAKVADLTGHLKHHGMQM